MKKTLFILLIALFIGTATADECPSPQLFHRFPYYSPIVQISESSNRTILIDTSKLTHIEVEKVSDYNILVDEEKNKWEKAKNPKYVITLGGIDVKLTYYDVSKADSAYFYIMNNWRTGTRKKLK